MNMNALQVNAGKDFDNEQAKRTLTIFVGKDIDRTFDYLVERYVDFMHGAHPEGGPNRNHYYHIVDDRLHRLRIMFRTLMHSGVKTGLFEALLKEKVFINSLEHKSKNSNDFVELIKVYEKVENYYYSFTPIIVKVNKLRNALFYATKGNLLEFNSVDTQTILNFTRGRHEDEMSYDDTAEQMLVICEVIEATYENALLASKPNLALVEKMHEVAQRMRVAAHEVQTFVILNPHKTFK